MTYIAEGNRIEPRYQVLEGSQSESRHFKFTVIDRDRPYDDDPPPRRIIDRYGAVCETYERAEAYMIADALNLMVALSKVNCCRHEN